MVEKWCPCGKVCICLEVRGAIVHSVFHSFLIIPIRWGRVCICFEKFYVIKFGGVRYVG
jgi:hypothetical protein